jgi:hypothetical protein
MAPFRHLRLRALSWLFGASWRDKWSELVVYAGKLHAGHPWLWRTCNRDFWFGGFRVRTLHLRQLLPAMVTLSIFGPLFGGIIVEPLHPMSRWLICSSSWCCLYFIIIYEVRGLEADVDIGVAAVCFASIMLC